MANVDMFNQIGSAIGSSLYQILKVSADLMRTLVGCGAAAGIAATFNALKAGSMSPWNSLSITIGSGGIFAPSLFLSAMAGWQTFCCQKWVADGIKIWLNNSRL